LSIGLASLDLRGAVSMPVERRRAAPAIER
jgi:hypothetical protein